MVWGIKMGIEERERRFRGKTGEQRQVGQTIYTKSCGKIMYGML
jgi:hypothetical protein